MPFFASSRSRNSLYLLLAPITLCAGLTGCGVSTNVVSDGSASAGLHGMVHGGQQPIVGSVVTLLAPGLMGYGSAPTTLATTVTGAGGGFTLPAYTCPTTSSVVYMTITGGISSGLVANPLIGEATLLGPCSSLSPATFIVVSEATTVAAAYALAPFASVTSAGTNIGTSATNVQGLTNSFGAFNNLVRFSDGYARGVNDLTGMVLPTAEINSLANILAACVNSTGSLVAGTACSTLITDTTENSVAPTNTFQAALNIALNPGTNVASLYSLSTPSQVFAPALSAAPNDFSLAIGFNGGAITQGGGTLGVAIDAAGNAWMTTGTGSAAVHSLTEISPAGVYLSGSTVATSTGFGYGNLVYPVGLNIDQNGAIYVANNGQNNLKKFNPNGTLQSTIAAGSFSGPNGLAIDGLGDPFIANFGSSQITKITAAGAEASNSPFTVGSGGVDITAGPLAVWSTDFQSYQVSRIDLSTFQVTNFAIGGPQSGIALDHANNAWIAVQGNGSVFNITNSGTFNSPYGGYLVAGARTQNIIVDGLGNVFSGALLNAGGMGRVLEYSNGGTLLSPGMGYTGSGVIPAGPGVPGGIAIDGSGNIWVSGTNLSTTYPNFVAEIIGMAAPVVTPKAAAITANMVGTRP